MLRHTNPTVVLLAALAATSCGTGSTDFVDDGSTLALCDLPASLTAQGGFPEGIPALTEPALVTADLADFLFDEDRVLGVVVSGEARAYPHNILWSHEVANDRFGDQWVTVSFCPLTGSGLAMDATVAGKRVEFGVSGLLFANNLVMYDRISEDIFGPQLSVVGKCQGFASVTPTLIPVREMSWGKWKELYPATKVLSDQTGYNRNYRFYPYGSYDELGSNDLLFTMPTDNSRPIKERVLGIRTSESDGKGYPFGELASLGDHAAVNDFSGGSPVVVFYDADDGEAAMAYGARVGGQTLTFEGTPDGWRDTETGSSWTLSGAAVAGPLAGNRLEPLANSYVVFWFAWRHFQPDAEIWLAE
jgi:Protein of unknown function (DUF3179)